jgi:hypothetical protein
VIDNTEAKKMRLGISWATIKKENCRLTTRVYIIVFIFCSTYANWAKTDSATEVVLKELQ